MPVAWTIGARAGDVAWRDPGPFVYATIQQHKGCPRGTCASGLHMVEGVGEHRWHGKRHAAGCRHWTHMGQGPYLVSAGLPRTIQTVRNLLLRRTRQPQCQRISDDPPALLPPSRGFRQYVSHSVTGHCHPWPVPLCDQPANTWLPYRPV